MRYELAVEIGRPPEEVYAFLADPGNLTRWQEDVVEVRDQPGSPLTEGTTFAEVRTFMGRRVESTLEVTAAEPARELSLRTLSGPVRVSVRHLFEPAAEGTLLKVVGEADAGKLGRLGGVLVRKAAEHRARANFERLRELLEAGT